MLVYFVSVFGIFCTFHVITICVQLALVIHFDASSFYLLLNVAFTAYFFPILILIFLIKM
ncbi:MAG: hypothetical protein D9C04_04580 [Nitrosopumilus sp. B06]|nr:MAG: hypothetical protein D9C04_04580 [Nitrosopumilus sp. B06]